VDLIILVEVVSPRGFDSPGGFESRGVLRISGVRDDQMEAKSNPKKSLGLDQKLTGQKKSHAE